MSLRPGGLVLRAGLELSDALVGLLPDRAAYALADLLGLAWYRFAPARRRLVAANLARVIAATGRKVSAAELRRLVRAAFVAHARYYLEVVRLPRHGRRDIDKMLVLDDAAGFEALARTGGVIGVSAHFGNFEPAAIWLASHGLRWVAPVERIEPPELFAYLRSRRGAGSVGGEMVPPPSSRRVLSALRHGEVVAIAADRDVLGSGREVNLFGHPARVPDGPATLAVLTGAPVVVGTLRRTAPNRFAARSDLVAWTPTGDRRADVAALTQRITDVLADHIARAPEQWWGAFQPIWDDLTPDRLPDLAADSEGRS
ncbi:MAG: lysophospholipid acyltransferase family protein [Candidatus Limnocylindria bacterium]